MVQPKKRRRKAKKRLYFGPEHEAAIIKYVISTDLTEKTQLYRFLIQPAFSELVDKIVFTYKFTTLPNIDYLRDDCKLWLTTILDKYDHNRGSKAFSYFSVITKNWFIHKVKVNRKEARTKIQLDDAVKIIEEQRVVVQHAYEKKRTEREFWTHLLKFVDIMISDPEVVKNENDKKVVMAIFQILREPDELEILNKKAIYLYLREITGLNTKQIANTLKKARVKYAIFANDWNEGKL
tara:strand:- start:6007 stop:6717 length:711 start_codon:yes stop_codon:yes gene_type:complete